MFALMIAYDVNFYFSVTTFLGVALVSLYCYLWERPLLTWLRAEAVVVALAICWLSYVVFEPILNSREPATTEETKLPLPAYDYARWPGLPVQADGRVKPFDTAARESLRHITGREKFEGQPAVPIVLQWMLAPRGAPGEQFTDWESKAFILCDHQDLRKEIYAHLAAQGEELTEEQLHGKFISPADLRDSPGLKKLLAGVARKRREDREKASQNMTPMERKADEVEGRLGEFLAISQVDAQRFSDQRRVPDPYHLVILDRVPSGPWFSIGELRDMQKDDKGGLWKGLMYSRLSQTPQLYINKNPQHLEAFQAFQQKLEKGEGLKAIEQLEEILRERREAKLKEFEKLTEEQWLRMLGAAHAQDRKMDKETRLKQVRAFYQQGDDKTIEDLRARVQHAMRNGYRADNPEYRMLHFDYLESLFPNYYAESLEALVFPREDAMRVLGAHARLVETYRAGNATNFDQEAVNFAATLQQVSDEFATYPGDDTAGMRLRGILTGRPTSNPSTRLLDLELSFNRAQPFMYAWIFMLAGAVCFIASLALGSRIAYVLGFVGYLVSIVYQIFGFYARVAISGRPPVSNMYETVVWVAFMSAVFALILELVYRRRVIALAGALVAALGLVLADQLPLALDPKINPLVPVLRSNYWLTVHVLTIVSSYAGGTLAWGLGNIALVLLAFGSRRTDVLKTLSHFTYRAIQIAVLLLAAGTFLGGWWAAESWGRFWGWDPKEVWALIALVCYVIPLHARYIGWVKDFGLAVAAVVCYAAIVMSWYGVNFVLGAGLHSYGFGGGGPWWVFLAGLINIEWVLIASIIYQTKLEAQAAESTPDESEMAATAS